MGPWKTVTVYHHGSGKRLVISQCQLEEFLAGGFSTEPKPAEPTDEERLAAAQEEIKDVTRDQLVAIAVRRGLNPPDRGPKASKRAILALILGEDT